MPEPRPIAFVPKWLRGGLADDMDVTVGSVPDQDPRVVTRLVPKDHGYTLTARTVSRIIDLKQDLAYHAARDVKDGLNPNFADLTGLPKALREAAALAVEPAESGSYVIPASLPPRSADLDADAVLKRYADLLAAIDEPQKSPSVSIGALQVCRELARLLDRDVEAIEVTTYDRENHRRPTVTFTPDSVARLDRLLEHRRTTTRVFEKLTGRLEALDIGKNEFHLKVPEHRRRIKGTVAFFAISTLRDYLGGTVTLEGDVVRDRRSVTMTAYRVVQGEPE